jgi:hypothetical protein
MGNPADEAAVKQAQYNAAMARRDAGLLGTEAIANAAQFTTQAEQRLAQGMAILGKTGNLSVDPGTAMESGVALGAKDTTEFTDLQKKAEDVAKKIADAGGVQTSAGAIQKAIADNIDTQHSALGPGGKALQDIRNPDALLHASGSDLLTMVSTRDQMERDKRTLFRSAENTQVAMLKAGEQYDVNAQYAKEAADWNTWATILGAGIKLAGIAAMF